MRNLERLRVLTKILFVISMIAIVLTPGFLLIYLISPGSVPTSIKFMELETLDLVSGLTVLPIFAGYCFFVYALYLFRQVLDLFARMKIFDDTVISHFNKIAKCITTGLLLIIVFGFILTVVNTQDFKLNLNTNSISGILFAVILSVFFKVLAEVFQMAKNIKHENDLTI